MFYFQNHIVIYQLIDKFELLNIVQGKTRSLNYLESNIVCDKDTDDDNGKLTPPYSQTASRVHVLLIAGYFSAIFSILSYNKMR